MISRVALGLLAVAQVAAWLTACAGAPPPQEATTVLAGSAARRLLVLPLNVTVAMPEELASQAPTVWQELESGLLATGLELKTVGFPVARRFWLESIRQVRGGSGGAAGFDEAARVFVPRLARHADFDTVVAVNLFVQEAAIDDHTARWNGVEREVHVEVIGARAWRASLTTPLVGAAPAASLHAVLLDAEGRRIHEAQTGLELLVDVRMTSRSDAFSGEPVLEFATRTEPFADREHLRAAITRVLAPFIEIPP